MYTINFKNLSESFKILVNLFSSLFWNQQSIHLIIIILLISACKVQESKEADLQSKFVNVLDIKKIPSSINDLEAFGFSDMGAWHGYSLPEIDSTNYLGGFCGPLLMKNNGTWLGNKSSQLVLMDENNQAIKWLKDSTKLNYFPGKLEQILKTSELSINQNLVFADNRTALITSSITNVSDKSLSLIWKLESKYLKLHFLTKRIENQIFVYLKDSSFFCLTFGDDQFEFQADSTGITITTNEKLNIKSNETYQLVHSESYFFNQKEYDAKKDLLKQYLNEPEKILAENSKRWNQYIANILNHKNELLDSFLYQKLAVKCVQTLMSNWRSPAGALKHNGVFPSAAYGGFYGFWSWDSWKQAAGISLFNDFLAKENVRSMFDFQNQAGMVADCVYHDSIENNWRDTKPPLAAWAVWQIFENSNDTAFVKEMYPKLIKYHQWWYKNRDNNKNGLCEYGSTDGSLIAAKWESGMDNAVRFDNSKILKNENGEWSIDQESIDLNTFLQKEKEYLAKLAFVINFQEDSKFLKQEAAKLSTEISSYFWSAEYKYFLDYNFKDKKFIGVYGPEGWLPLWTGVATKEQAASIVSVMMDKNHFNTKVPLPTLDCSNKNFNPLEGYWRGPVWLDQVYFGIQGLKNYGYTKEANELKQNLFKNSEGLLTDMPVFENYHPISGQGLNARHFSWSAAHLLMFLTD